MRIGEDYDATYERALAYAQAHHPNQHAARQLAFASGVTYLLHGVSMGIGPTVRVHAVSWSLAIDATKVQGLTMLTPNQYLPMAGQWGWEAAVKHCEPICFGPITALHLQCWRQESCFDDDPADITVLKKIAADN